MFVLAALHQALQQCYLQSFALFYSAKNIAELLPHVRFSSSQGHISSSPPWPLPRLKKKDGQWPLTGIRSPVSCCPAG